MNQNLLLEVGHPLPSAAKAAGFIKIPYSTGASGYGFIPLPFAVVGAANGPTVLALAGCFGDELEGQTALASFVRALDPAKMSGRLIVLPMANPPASRVGKRNSPLDGANLNRSFPGDLFGGPTAAIAHCIEHHLMAHSDVVVDIHTAGECFAYRSCATLIYTPDPVHRAKRMAVASAFGADSVLIFNSYEERGTSGAAKRAGAVRIGAEISGPDSASMVSKGLHGILTWAGVIEDPAVDRPAEPVVSVTHAETDYVYALWDGLFTPEVRLGDQVSAGDVAGHIHDPSLPFATPHEVRFSSAGTVMCSRSATRVERGDFLLHVAAPGDEQLAAELAVARRDFWLRDQVMKDRLATGQRARRAGATE